MAPDRAESDLGRVAPGEDDFNRHPAARRYNLVTVPRIRLLGLNAILVAVLLHHALIGPAAPLSAVLAFAGAVELYCLGSWALLVAVWERLKGRLDIQFVFLALDIAVCVIATYVTGGERSLLFFLIALRLSDTSITLKRTVVLAHLVPLLYLLMLAYIAYVDQRPIPFGPAAVNTFTLYGTALYFTLVGRTASALRARTQSAIRVSRDLVAQLEEKSRRLELSMQEARQASQAKSRLLATVSHELRTPVTEIITQTEMVLEDADPAEDAAAIADLNQVIASARQLSAIIEDLLSVSLLEGERLPVDVEHFDVRELVDELAATTTVAIARNENRLEVSLPPDPGWMRTDRSKLRHILLILLGNAAKFTAEGRVSLAVERRPGHAGAQTVVFRVEDTGKGVPENIQETLFTPFTQGDSSTTRRYGGIGLGLVIAKRYSVLISAELSFETEADRGTSFTLSVPAELPMGPAGGPSKMAAAS